MEGVGVELWHLAVAFAGAVSAVGLPLLTLYMRLRSLNRDRETERKEQLEEAKEEAIRKHEIERRLDALEKDADSHAEKDRQEHAEIRDTVNSSAERICEQLREIDATAKEDRRLLHERLNGIERETATLSGKVDVLVGQDRARTLMDAGDHADARR